MKTIPVAELKAHFSRIIKEVQNGEEIIISYGKQKVKIAVLIPYSRYKKKNNIKIGLLKGKASIKIKESFSMTTEDLLSL